MIFELIVLVILVLVGYIFLIKKPFTTTITTPPVSAPSTIVQNKQTTSETVKSSNNIQIQKDVKESTSEQVIQKEDIKQAPEILKTTSILEEVQPLLEDRLVDFKKSEVLRIPEVVETKESQIDTKKSPEVLDEQISQTEAIIQKEIKPISEAISESIYQEEQEKMPEQSLEPQDDTLVHKEETIESTKEVDTTKSVNVREYHLVGDSAEQENLNDIPEAFVNQIQEQDSKPQVENPIEDIAQRGDIEFEKPFAEPFIEEEVHIQKESKPFLEPNNAVIKEEEESNQVHNEEKAAGVIPRIAEQNVPVELNEEKEEGHQQADDISEPLDMERTLKDRSLNRQASAKITVKKGFNFRANRSKVESILKKENSMNKGSFHLDSSTDNDNTVLTAYSSNQTLQEKNDEKDLSVREENILKTEEEPLTKKRGFNFKNPKKKSFTTEKNDKSSVTSSQELQQAENVDPALQSNVAAKSPALGDSGKLEVKKAKGFNFRNSGRVKVE